MSGWEDNKGLFWKAVGVAAAILVVWGVSALAWGSRKRGIRRENRRYLDELSVRTKSGTPSPEALSELTERLKELSRLREKLRSVVFVLDGPFREAKTRLDFDQLAKVLRDSIGEYGPPVADAKTPLGFDEKLLREEEENVRRLLRRLSVVKRFVEAARKWKVASIRKIKHEAVAEGGQKGLDFHRTVVPIHCVFDADEKSLIGLLHDIMAFPRKGLVPTKLSIQVEQRTLDTFRVDAKLCGVFIDGGGVETEKHELPRAKISPERY